VELADKLERLVLRRRDHERRPTKPADRLK